MNTTFKTLASLALLSPMANGALVALNFQGNQVANLLPGTTAGSNAGTIIPQRNWNNALNGNNIPNSLALISSTGIASGLTAAWNGPDSWNAGGPVGASGNEQMSYGFMKSSNLANGTVTFSGFAIGTLFDMVIYTASDNVGAPGTYTLDDTLSSTATFGMGAGNTATFTDNSTRHAFTNLTAVGGSVTLTMSGNGAGLAGVQFSVIPEPSAASLIGLGALGLLARRKRSQA